MMYLVSSTGSAGASCTSQTAIETDVLRAEALVGTYSRVHKSWNSFFSKILEKPSIVQKKMLPHIKGLDFSQR